MNKKIFCTVSCTFVSAMVLAFGVGCNSAQAMLRRSVSSLGSETKRVKLDQKEEKEVECTARGASEEKVDPEQEDLTPTEVMSDIDDVGDTQSLIDDMALIDEVNVPNVAKIELTEEQVKEKTEILNSSLEAAILKLKDQPGCLRISGDTAVVGDIHGDYGALCGIVDALQTKLDSKEICNVLFLGDFLDRFETRSTDTFIKLLDFFNKNANVFILRGNHENLYGDFYSDANDEPVFKAIREKYPTRDVNPIDRFKESLPHAAIINEDTLAVHGGIPWFKPEHSMGMNGNVDVAKCLDDFFTSETDKKGTKALSAVLCAVWSDFNPDSAKKMQPNKKRGVYSSCLFGLDDVKEFFTGAAKERTGLSLKCLICGHDHRKGAFFVRREYGVSVTTVISSPVLLSNFGVDSWGCVALVKKGCEPVILFRVVID